MSDGFRSQANALRRLGVVEPLVEALTAPASAGIKDDGIKPDYSLLSLWAMEPAVRVLMMGAEKYARNNWKLFGKNDLPRFEAAILRHVAAIENGTPIDQESGQPHMAHILCEAMFWLYHNRRRSE